MGPQRLNSSPHGRAPTLQYFLPPQQSRYQNMTPGFTTHESSHGRKEKRTLNTPVSPWEISDTYSELQMSTILMSTPKIWFLGIRFLRIALKSQQLGRDCTPKQTGDRYSDPCTRRDLSHPGDVNLKLSLLVLVMLY